MDPTDLINYANAIKRIESSGNYGSIGPATRNGDRAYGAYQVMGNNIPGWTQKHFGQSLSPQQFLNNKQAQDAVFNGEFGGYVSKYGNPQDAASTWFTGRPQAQGGNSNDGYITGNEYVNRFNKALGGGSALDAVNAAAGGAPQQPAVPQGALAFAGGPKAPADAEDAPATPGALFPGEAPSKANVIGAGLANIASSLAGINNPSQAAGLRGMAQNIAAQGGNKYQYQMGANGQLVRIDKESGKVDSIAIPGSQKGDWQPIMGKDADGNPVFKGSFSASTNEYKSAPGQSEAAGPPIGGDPSLSGEDRYNSLTSDEKKQMDAWKNGTGIQPSQYSMRNPKTAKLVEAANAIGIDMSKYGERQAFFKGMASKNATQTGGQFVMAPTVLDHLDNLTNDYLALGNSNGGPGGYGTTAANALKNAVGGNARQALQTSMDRNADTAGKEITSFLTRGHGGVSERQEAHEKLALPNGSPEVQAAALEAYRKQVSDRFYNLLEGSKGSVGDHPELAKVEAAFKAKDEALQQKIANLKASKFAPAAAAPAAAIPSSWDDAQKAGWK